MRRHKQMKSDSPQLNWYLAWNLRWGLFHDVLHRKINWTLSVECSVCIFGIFCKFVFPIYGIYSEGDSHEPPYHINLFTIGDSMLCPGRGLFPRIITLAGFCTVGLVMFLHQQHITMQHTVVLVILLYQQYTAGCNMYVVSWICGRPKDYSRG